MFMFISFFLSRPTDVSKPTHGVLLAGLVPEFSCCWECDPQPTVATDTLSSEHRPLQYGTFPRKKERHMNISFLRWWGSGWPRDNQPVNWTKVYVFSSKPMKISVFFWLYFDNKDTSTTSDLLQPNIAKKAHKLFSHKLSVPPFVPGTVPGTNRVCPRDKPGEIGLPLCKIKTKSPVQTRGRPKTNRTKSLCLCAFSCLKNTTVFGNGRWRPSRWFMGRREGQVKKLTLNPLLGGSSLGGPLGARWVLVRELIR